MGLFDKIELPDVKHKIVVASGKGGVGKSMVSGKAAGRNWPPSCTHGSWRRSHLS